MIDNLQMPESNNSRPGADLRNVHSPTRLKPIVANGGRGFFQKQIPKLIFLNTLLANAPAQRKPVNK